MTSKTLILIDGHALAYRQYFALERTRMKTSGDRPTWAVYGFFKAIFDLLKKVKPDAIAVAFDLGRQTFRLKEYSEYKANRQTMPDSLRDQMGLLNEGIKAFDIPIYTREGFEADDIIGTISDKAKNLGHKVLILTGDQDSFQLVDNEGQITVLIPSKGELIEYDKDKVFEKMAVWPHEVIDYKGLRGDTSDNIPGVKGVGEKTAAKLIEQFKTMENLYENVEDVSSASLKKKLVEGKEMAFMSKFLATIDKNVPIEFDFEHTHLNMPNVANVVNFLKDVQFGSMLKQLPVLLAPFNDGVEPEISQEQLYSKKTVVASSLTDGQLGLFSQESEIVEQSVSLASAIEVNANIVDSETKFDELLKLLQERKIFSFDAETTSLNTFDAKIVGLAFGVNKNVEVNNGRVVLNSDFNAITDTYYLPVGHIEGQQLDINYVIPKLKPLLEDKNLYKVLQNAKYEINLLKNYDITLKGLVFDTMLSSYIVNPLNKHGLKAQALRILNCEMTEIVELIGKGKTAVTIDSISIEKTSNYACADAKSTLDLAIHYVKVLSDKENSLLYDIEFPLITVLADIERTGIALDCEYLAKLSSQIHLQLTEIETKIYEYAGEHFNINSPKQVSEILFDKLELSVKGKAKTQTGVSTNAKVLESLAHEHPIVGLLLEHRHLSKLKSTYIDALPDLVNPKTHRLHTSFNQTITTTGRLSSSNPNLQNIPIKTELGNSIRAAFVPCDTENSVIFAADYSQIELRLLAHYSKDPILLQAFLDNRDIHLDTASKVFGVPVEEVTKDMRRKAKAVNFGIIYGQTAYGLASSLGISSLEAKSIIDKYFETYPNIRKFMDDTVVNARECGYVETLYGRKRDFKDDLNSRNKTIREFAERAAINAPLQGTAADLIKIAMIKLHNKLQEFGFKSKIILQVHDELVLEVPKSELVEVSELVKTCMELDQPLDIPLVVDMASGPNWMEA